MHPLSVFLKVKFHTRDKQIGLPQHGRPVLLSLVWLQTELDSTQLYYHYKFSNKDRIQAHSKTRGRI